MVLSLVQNSKDKSFNLKEYYQIHKAILFKRKAGGFGDILMMRMIFEDIKENYPEFEIHWAIPKKYHDIGSHPFVDKILDFEDVTRNDYINSINLSEACIVYEMKHERECFLHRSDIWAKHCGIELKNHNMHLNPDKNAVEKMKFLFNEFKKFKDKKTIILCPFSANPPKDFTSDQIKFIINYLESKNLNCFLVHNQLDFRFFEQDYPFFKVTNFKDTIATHYLADGVISVDTGHLHCAAGLKKPLMGIFGYVDGDIYAKYYDLVILQKHRKYNNWPCNGPCWNYFKCTVPHTTSQKPCMTMLTYEEIAEKIDLFLHKYNIQG